MCARKELLPSTLQFGETRNTLIRCGEYLGGIQFTYLGKLNSCRNRIYGLGFTHSEQADSLPVQSLQCKNEVNLWNTNLILNK